MKKGVITVYLTITFTIFLSLFISALEAAKYSAYRVIAECAVKSAVVSAFGEYNKELYDQYDLLFIDLSYMSDTASKQALSGRVEMYLNENLQEPETNLLFARDLFGAGSGRVELTNGRMASDLYGSPLKKQATEYMKDELAADFATDLLSLVRIKKEYRLDEEDFNAVKTNMEAEVNRALEERSVREQENAKTGIKRIVDEEGEKTIRALSDFDIPIVCMKPLDYWILQRDAFGVSGRVFNPLEMPSARIANLGSSAGTFAEADTDPLSDVFFTEYLVRKTGNYLHPKENSFLRYETEYLIGGSANDSLNLSITIREIFYIRAMANYMSLEMDEEKREAVDSIAEELSAVTEVPAPVIATLIMTNWGAAEATYDLREMMSGEKYD